MAEIVITGEEEMLKSFIKKLEDVDEKFRDLYEKSDDGFMLQVDDKDYKTKLNEFRNNNTTLNNEITTLKKDAEKFKDIDPTKYAEMGKQITALEDAKLLEAGNVDELIEQRTERMRNEYTDKMEKLTANATQREDEVKTLKVKLDRITINEAVTKAIEGTATTKKGALSYIQTQASNVWAVGEKGLEARDTSGNLMYGKDGKEPLTLKEWAEDLYKTTDFLFEPNSGGNAPGANDFNPTTKTIAIGDKDQFANNIEDIASGKITVK